MGFNLQWNFGRKIQRVIHLTYQLSVSFLMFSRLLSCHVGAPNSLSRGFSHPYQIVFTLFDIGIELTRVNGVDSYACQLINPNFRVGQLLIFAKSKVVFILHFE